MVKSTEEPKRRLAARAFTIVEDVVYLGLGLLLAGSAVVLLISGLVSFVQNVLARTMMTNMIPLLDQLLLILLVIELLYTVQVSFREHILKPEPFLLVGLIAAIRRVLVLTAQFAELKDEVDLVFRHLIIELGVLTVLIVALVLSLVLLRKAGVATVAERTT